MIPNLSVPVLFELSGTRQAAIAGYGFSSYQRGVTATYVSGPIQITVLDYEISA